jgi:hypothetical protein|tara:strand:+ start:1278 stop:1436 length:159 start_codon:yes stop_codon:yes gene_type:complete
MSMEAMLTIRHNVRRLSEHGTAANRMSAFQTQKKRCHGRWERLTTYAPERLR